MIKEILNKAKEFFTGKKEVRCRRCGRILKNPAAKERGTGDCCFKKILDEKYMRKLFTPKEEK